MSKYWKEKMKKYGGYSWWKSKWNDYGMKWKKKYPYADMYGEDEEKMKMMMKKKERWNEMETGSWRRSSLSSSSSSSSSISSSLSSSEYAKCGSQCIIGN